jgi:hypothetical protein
MQPDTAFEKHYRISELARLWGLGRETVRKICKEEPGIVKVRFGQKKNHMRPPREHFASSLIFGGTYRIAITLSAGFGLSEKAFFRILVNRSCRDLIHFE